MFVSLVHVQYGIGGEESSLQWPDKHSRGYCFFFFFCIFLLPFVRCDFSTPQIEKNSVYIYNTFVRTHKKWYDISWRFGGHAMLTFFLAISGRRWLIVLWCTPTNFIIFIYLEADASFNYNLFLARTHTKRLRCFVCFSPEIVFLFAQVVCNWGGRLIRMLR